MVSFKFGRLLPLLILAIGLMITYMLHEAALHSAHEAQKEAFNFNAREILLRIEQRMKSYEHILRSAKGLYAASKSVERDEFRDYVASLQLAAKFPGLQGIGYAQIVLPQDKNRHVEAVRKEGYPSYGIRPEGERELFTSIVFLEPFAERNLRAFGYDMYSEPVRRAAMEAARDEDAPVISGKVTLVQEAEKEVQAGFLMYLPVYRNGRPHQTEEERRANIIGWVYMPFRMNDLMRGILGNQADNFDIEIFDSHEADSRTLMYDSKASDIASLYEYFQFFDVPGHRWHVRLHSLPAFEASIDARPATLIWQAGILMSLLLSLLVWQLVSGRERAVRLAESMTSDLRESEAELRAILEAIPVPLALNDEQGNITYLNNAFIQNIGYSLNDIPTLADWWSHAYPDPQYRQWVKESWQANLEKTRKTGEKFAAMELNVSCMNGSVRTFMIGAAPLKQHFADTHLVILYDITERKQAEKELRTLSTAIEQSPLSVVITDLNANIRYVNPCFVKTTGYSKEEAMGKNPRILQSGQTSMEVYREMWETLTSGKVWHGEIVNKRKNGELYWEEVHISPVLDASGKVLHYVAVKLEITQRKKAEDALRQSEARLHTLYDSTSDAVMLLDNTGFLDCNNATLSMFGCASKEDFCKHPGELSPPLQPGGADSMTLVNQQIEIALNTGRNFFEWSYRRLDTGEIFPADVLLNSMELDGRTILQATVRDITERRRIESALVESKGRIEMLLNSVAEGIYGVNMDGNCSFINSAGLRLLGYKEESELLGRHMHELIHHTHADGSHYPTSECILYNAMHTKECVHFDDEIFWRKDGSSFPVDCWSRPTLLNGEEGAVITFFDITERREYEEELKRSNADLEQFSYAVSHDMRQPLRMVSSYLQLIERSMSSQLDDEKREYFGFAIDGAKRIDRMLVDLLEYSRVGRKGEPPAFVESRELLDEALQFLRPNIVEADARVNISGEWPRVHVSHNEVLRLLQNLIGNAIKYRIAGRIPEILISSAIAGREWRVCVADNGVGIVPSQINRLFHIFQRLQTRDAYEGTGVGLALCRKIAEHHKGRIWAESEGEGLGSQFHVAIPVLHEEN